MSGCDLSDMTCQITFLSLSAQKTLPTLKTNITQYSEIGHMEMEGSVYELLKYIYERLLLLLIYIYIYIYIYYY